MRPSIRPTALVLIAAAMIAPAGAGAANVSTDCAGIQGKLDAANNGDVITITQTPCNLAAPLTLPKTHSAPFAITLQGSGSGVVLDGNTLADRIMTGEVPAPKALDITLRNLTFQHSTAPPGEGGGALLLTGPVGVTLDNDRFFDDVTDPTGEGGGARISSTGTRPTVVLNSTFSRGTSATMNSAAAGGGLSVNNSPSGPSIQVTGSSFDGNHARSAGGALGLFSGADHSITLNDNVIRRNTSGDYAAGASVVGGSVALRRNTFSRNVVDNTTGGGPEGGGLAASGSGDNATLTQVGNRFDRNQIKKGAQSFFAVDGAGEFALAFKSVSSRDDRFTNNSMPAPSGAGQAEGTALAMRACSLGAFSQDRFENLVVAGNTAGGFSEGAVYVGCGGQPSNLTLVNSTVVGNVANGAGSTGGVAGDSDDKLTLVNSIVTRNPGGPDVSGFVSRTVRYSDACTGASPLPGPGNICANPLLVAPGPGAANVHQTFASPTVDAGFNPSVPASLVKDFEGQARVIGGVVDMGADEIDNVRPVFKSASVSPSEFPTGKGTKFKYKLSEAARVRFTIKRVTKGRKVGGKCVKRTKQNRSKPKCTRLVGLGSYLRQSAAGKSTKPFSGKIGGKTLKPGRYRALLVATDAQGNKSKPQSLKFRVTK